MQNFKLKGRTEKVHLTFEKNLCLQFGLTFLLFVDLSRIFCRSFGDINEDYNKPLDHDEGHDGLDDYDDGCRDACTWLWCVRALHRLSKQAMKEEEKVERRRN